MSILKYGIEVTKDEVKALRKCRSVCFHYKNRESYIRAIVGEGKNEYEVRIDCGSELICFESGKEIYEATYVDTFAQLNEFYTIARMIKAGDKLTLVWRAGNNNQYLKQAGLFHDELLIKIERRTSSKMKVFTFKVGDAIAPENLARMIKTQYR